MAKQIRFSSSLGYIGSSSEAKSIPFGAVVSPFEKLRDSDNGVQNIEMMEENVGDIRCTNCGSFATPLTRSEASLACTVCGVKNVITVDHAKSPVLEAQCVEIVSGTSGGLVDSNRRNSLVFVIDTHLQSQQLRDVHDSIKSTILGIGKHKVNLCLIVISRVVTVYRCCLDGVVSGDVFGSVDGIKFLPDHQITSYLTSASACFDSFLTSILSIRGARKPSSNSQSSQTRRRKVVELLPRNLVLAVELGLQLLASHQSKNSSTANSSSRIIVCLDGYPNVDSTGVSQPPVSLSSQALAEDKSGLQEAHGVMRELADQAKTLCVGIDVFCSGLQSMNAPMLYDLVYPTGGLVLVQQSFAQSEFGYNLNKMLAEQVIFSLSDDHATLEVITSSNIKIAHLGPASCYQDSDFKHSLKFHRFDPRASVSLYFEFPSSNVEDIHIQFIAHSCVAGEHFRRITSMKIEKTVDDSAYLASVDEEVVVVLLAKAAVQNANDYSVVGGISETESLRLASCDRLDRWLSDLTKYHMKKVGLRLNDMTNAALPASMSSCLLRCLYFLRFGQLLGDTHNAFDDVFCLRWLFLRLDLFTSLAIIAPRVLSTRAHGTSSPSHTLTQVSGDTLALWSDAFVVGDLFSRIVVWRGHAANALDAPEESLSQYMASIQSHRFPTPTVIRCAEGSSMARIIVSRLNPTHQDTLKDQCLSLPCLSELTPSQREDLCRKFPKTDTPSAAQWLRRLISSR